MRFATSVRVRAAGILLLEMASLGLLILSRYGKDRELHSAIRNVVRKAKEL